MRCEKIIYSPIIMPFLPLIPWVLVFFGGLTLTGNTEKSAHLNWDELIVLNSQHSF